jgi:phospholipid-transporting ATPase
METSHINDNETASDLHGTIQFEQPNNRLYNFDARIQIHNGPPISLDPDQLLLCGSTLRNTAWIIGVVIYTGHETKLMKNRNPTPRKVSKVEKKANRLVFIIMATQLAVCFCCVAGIVLWTIYHDNKIWYFNVAQFGKSMAGMAYMGFRNFWTFLILYVVA